MGLLNDLLIIRKLEKKRDELADKKKILEKEIEAAQKTLDGLTAQCDNQLKIMKANCRDKTLEDIGGHVASIITHLKNMGII